MSEFTVKFIDEAEIVRIENVNAIDAINARDIIRSQNNNVDILIVTPNHAW
jgi:hypothetical protein